MALGRRALQSVAISCRGPMQRARSSSSSSRSSWDMHDLTRFAKLKFWEDYHVESGEQRLHHEWFLESSEVVDLLLPYVKAVCDKEVEGQSMGSSAPALLHLGCGTSALGLQLSELEPAAAAGAQVVNLDFSPVAINSMREAYSKDASHERNSWIVGDALDMPFSAGFFDLVVDKGTFDAFEYADTGNRNAPLSAALCREVNRVLKRHALATWVQITHSDPELRLEMLCKSLPPGGSLSVRDTWSIGHRSLGEDDNGFEYFLYIIRRRPHFTVHCKDHLNNDVVLGTFVDERDALDVATRHGGHVRSMASKI